MNDSLSSLGSREVKCSARGHTACSGRSPRPRCQPSVESTPLCSSISPARKQLHPGHPVWLGAPSRSLIRFNVLNLRTSIDCSYLGSWGGQMPREELVSAGYQRASSQDRAAQWSRGLGTGAGPPSFPLTPLLPRTCPWSPEILDCGKSRLWFSKVRCWAGSARKEFWLFLLFFWRWANPGVGGPLGLSSAPVSLQQDSGSCCFKKHRKCPETHFPPFLPPPKLHPACPVPPRQSS